MSTLFRLTPPLLLVLTIALPVRAEDPAPNLCHEGEYVLSVGNIPALRDKAVESIDDVTAEDLAISDENAHTILITREEETGVPGTGEVIPYRASRDLCEKMRARDRETLRNVRGGGRAKIIRRYSCSCNSVISVSATPNDPQFSYSWGLNNSNDVDIDAPEAWNIAQGSMSTVVGIIDTGVEYTHPDLSANMWRNPGEIPGNGIDDDRNGYVDDYHGINTITNSGDPMDDNGHGTHVAGIIGAQGNNGIGGVGVNWNVRMVAIKFLGSNGSGSLFDAIEGIDYATSLKNRGVNLVMTNNSWGGGGSMQPMYDAITRAQNAGILFIAAAGNNGTNIDASPSYPASYPHDNIISVAAIDSNGNLASFSNYGAQNVDIAAPGVNIASTYINSRYVYLSGTSMAAPFVTGGLALLKSYSPGITWQNLKSICLATGDLSSALTGVVGTSKRLNAYSMLVAAGTPPAPTPTPQPTITPTPGPTATPTPTPTPPPLADYSISGVVRAAGTGLAEAQVELKVGNLTAVRMTGATGQFNFGTFKANQTYTISVVRSGYSIPMHQGYLNANQVISLDASPAQIDLRVRVINTNKFPIPGVTVNAGPLGYAFTDTSGWASFKVAYGIDYNVQLSSTSYAFDKSALFGKIWGDVSRVVVAEPK